jgi:hypothetical protein
LKRIPIGIDDQEAPVPSHIALFYETTAELRQRQAAFLLPALDRKDEGVVFVGAPGVPEALLRYLETDTERDLTAMRHAGRIVLAPSSSDADEHLEYFLEAVRSTIARGAKTVRVIANVEWEAPEWPYPEDVLWVESRLNIVLSSLPVVVICAYDVMSLPGPALVLGALHSHPQLIHERYGENGVFQSPDQYVRKHLLQLPWLDETT